MKNAVIIIVFPSIDARTANDMSGAQVCLGFSGVNRLTLVNYNERTGFGGVLFFNAGELRDAMNSVERILNGENHKNQTSRCCAGLKIEVGEAVIWHEAEAFLNENGE